MISVIHAGPHEVRALSGLTVCACGRAVGAGRDGRCEECADLRADRLHELARGELEDES